MTILAKSSLSCSSAQMPASDAASSGEPTPATEQELAFRSAYGEAMFYAHVIEDLLALHLFECSYFHVNGYPGISRRTIQDMKHEQRIDELLTIYCDQDKRDGSIARFVTALHDLRKIRNHLAHAFIPQVGSDLASEEGVDQILCMLRKVSYWERAWLQTLKQAHETVLRGAITHCLDAVMQREDPPFNATVSRSKIQQHLDALRKQLE